MDGCATGGINDGEMDKCVEKCIFLIQFIKLLLKFL